MIRSIAFDDVTFAYENGGAVFRHVSFTLPDDGMLWVRAGRERGRSTLLKLLGAMVRPTAGRVLIDGRDAAEATFAESLATRLQIGFGFDVGGLISNQTLAQNLLLPLLYHRSVDELQAQARVAELMERFGLHDVAGERPYNVTGSQRKLTCVLRAFVHEPSLVLLDEPLTGLKRGEIDELVIYVREAYARRGLRRLVLTGENPLLAEPFGALPLNISRDRIWSGSAA